MPKSYKICPVQAFNRDAFARQPLYFEPQQGLQGVPQGPRTNIFRSLETIALKDFEAYLIEHEYEVNIPGRYMSVSFPSFIAKGVIHGYYTGAERLLLLSGKKADILDFCRATTGFPDVKVTILRVDMKALQQKIAEVRLAWFHFQSGRVRASALMGAHIEETDAFRQAKTEGEISTLSFYIEDKSGNHHPVMVTDDGAVVLQRPYPNAAAEIELVLYVKENLLDGICEEIDAKYAKRSAWEIP